MTASYKNKSFLEWTDVEVARWYKHNSMQTGIIYSRFVPDTMLTASDSDTRCVVLQSLRLSPYHITVLTQQGSTINDLFGDRIIDSSSHGTNILAAKAAFEMQYNMLLLSGFRPVHSRPRFWYSHGVHKKSQVR